MMDHQEVTQAPLFYSFHLDAHIPANHLLRGIDRFLDLSELHQRLTRRSGVLRDVHLRRSRDPEARLHSA